MTIVRIALLCALLTGGPAPAAAAASRADSDVIQTIGEQDLAALVTAVGDRVDAVHPFGDPSVRGRTADGVRYVLIAVDCPSQKLDGCTGLMMQIRFTAEEDVALERVNDANFNEAAVTTWYDRESKVVGFTRFINIDGGVTWANLKSNLRMLFEAQHGAQASVWPEP